MDAPEFDTYFELSKRDEKIEAHMNPIRQLRAQIAKLKSNKSDAIGTNKPLSLDSQNFHYQDTINKLHNENECFRAENSKIKQHYKELYDSIKVTRNSHNEKITSLQNEIVNLKAQIKGKCHSPIAIVMFQRFLCFVNMILMLYLFRAYHIS